ncbi:MAG: MoaD/ThiS family protein [Deltaproteobacteria bacterium]|nr:MoaD/ThiS family protein [Deltaproteobacteria bacterium]
MSVIIEMAPYLRRFTGNNDRVAVSGATVRVCLSALVAQFPEIKEWLFDTHGTLKTIIVMNRKIITLKDLDSKICDNDQIRIIMPLGGG